MDVISISILSIGPATACFRRGGRTPGIFFIDILVELEPEIGERVGRAVVVGDGRAAGEVAFRVVERDEAFRTSTEFAALCQRVSQALREGEVR